MREKKYTVKIDHELGERIKALAQKRGMTLRQMQERMITIFLEADRLAEEIRG